MYLSKVVALDTQHVNEIDFKKRIRALQVREERDDFVKIRVRVVM